ncbi:phage tail tube protein [Streptomyces mirabilis]|uniref:phage tail tube protein n=1 Tax=Streptomyces mirabilis TaxID=68239 RepID=UPI0036A5B1E0
MPTPTTYASQLTFAGLASEQSQGTALAPTSTILLNKDPGTKDNQVYLEDMALRNAMAEVYGAVQGPLSADWQLDGDVRSDTQGYLLGNILGDWTQTQPVTTPSTTTSGTNNAGATQISTTLGTGFTTGMTVQVGTGLTAEIVTIGTPSGNNLPIVKTARQASAGTLAFTHAAAQTVAQVDPAQLSTYAFALQNAGATNSQALVAQARSLTLTDWSGVTASTGARQFPGSMLSELSYSFDATKLLTFAAKASSWGSAAAGVTPTPSISSLVAIAGWNCAVGIGGPASGGTLVPSVTSMDITLTRALKVYPALGAKQPYIIRQGKFGVSGRFTIVAADETHILNYLNNVQPQLQIVYSTGSGLTAQTIQFDLAQVYYKAAALERGQEEVDVLVEFTGVANTTNVGASGGFSPLMVTIKNTVAVGTF